MSLSPVSCSYLVLLFLPLGQRWALAPAPGERWALAPLVPLSFILAGHRSPNRWAHAAPLAKPVGSRRTARQTGELTRAAGQDWQLPNTHPAVLSRLVLNSNSR